VKTVSNSVYLKCSAKTNQNAVWDRNPAGEAGVKDYRWQFLRRNVVLFGLKHHAFETQGCIVVLDAEVDVSCCNGRHLRVISKGECGGSAQPVNYYLG
jgi:hypothetical protein